MNPLSAYITSARNEMRLVPQDEPLLPSFGHMGFVAWVDYDLFSVLRLNFDLGDPRAIRTDDGGLKNFRV